MVKTKTGKPSQTQCPPKQPDTSFTKISDTKAISASFIANATLSLSPHSSLSFAHGHLAHGRSKAPFLPRGTAV